MRNARRRPCSGQNWPALNKEEWRGRKRSLKAIRLSINTQKKEREAVKWSVNATTAIDLVDRAAKDDKGFGGGVSNHRLAILIPSVGRNNEPNESTRARLQKYSAHGLAAHSYAAAWPFAHTTRTKSLSPNKPPLPLKLQHGRPLGYPSLLAQ